VSYDVTDTSDKGSARAIYTILGLTVTVQYIAYIKP